MMRRAAGLAIALVLLVGGCGSDQPTKREFLDHLEAISRLTRTPAEKRSYERLMGCVYDQIKDDDLLRQVMSVDPDQPYAHSLSAQMSRRMAACGPRAIPHPPGG